VRTHADVARASTSRRADVGLGVETAALTYGLDFIPLTTERYDLAIPAEVWRSEAVQALAGWLDSDEAKTVLNDLGGYETQATGQVEWVE